jgi:hypothetical protein
VAAARSDQDRAATLAGAAAAIRETIASPQLPDLVISRHLLQAAQRDTDQQRWRAAWETGHALGTADAVAYALGQDRQRHQAAHDTQASYPPPPHPRLQA